MNASVWLRQMETAAPQQLDLHSRKRKKKRPRRTSVETLILPTLCRCRPALATRRTLWHSHLVEAAIQGVVLDARSTTPGHHLHLHFHLHFPACTVSRPLQGWPVLHAGRFSVPHLTQRVPTRTSGGVHELKPLGVHTPSAFTAMRPRHGLPAIAAGSGVRIRDTV